MTRNKNSLEQTTSFQEISQWRKELRDLLDRISQDLEFRNGATLSFEVLFSEKDRTSIKLDSLEKEIDSLKMERERLNESTTSTATNNSFDSYYQSSRMNEYGSLGRNKAMPDRCRRCTFLEWKVSESLVELRQMKNVVYETEVKCEKTRATVIDAQKMCAQTKQKLTDLKTHLAAEKRMKSISNCEGHLIWRIDQFAAKLKDAKENDIVLRSPMFSNRQYGYNLRVC